ncbi:hypothetical protein HEP81_01917 [Streptomyces griseofuscus]|uniref:Uncharacterized protein n=1 Tax=Streptomyces griseofuscus TaxID=146922 RepID=A0A7H1PW15_9ACTN|nr:hypothetical protein HEP81_01917 [Streptomyces griseofuscus]
MSRRKEPDRISGSSKVACSAGAAVRVGSSAPKSTGNIGRSTGGTVNSPAYGRSSPGVRFFSSVAPVILSTAFSMISVL